MKDELSELKPFLDSAGRLLAAAGVLMLLAGGIFALMRKWRYAALLGAGALGVIFGVAPAMKAAGMQPVDALRQE